MAGSSVVITLDPPGPYVADQVVQASFAFETGGAPADPTDITATVQRPDGTLSTYTYSGAQIAKDSTGNYHMNLTLDGGSVWMLHVQGAGAIVAAAMAEFSCLDPFPTVPFPPSPVGLDNGKIAKVSSGVYQPYGGAANQPLVWNALTGWTSQALNLSLAGTSITNNLPVTNIAPGSVGQVLTTIAGPAVAWAASVTAPGGGPGEVQYNNGGVLDGASGIKVVGAETAFAYGAMPASQGTHRHSQGQGVWVRNNANTLDLRVLQMSDDLSIGDLTNGGFTFYDVASGKTHVFRVAGTGEFELTATQLDLKTNIIVHGSNFSTSGILNAENGVVVVAARNVGNTGDVQLVRLDSVDKVFVGDATNAAAVLLSARTGGFHELRVNNVAEYDFDASRLDMTNNRIQFGTNPATGALFGVPHASNIIAGRNQANSADSQVLRWGQGLNNIIILGDGTNGQVGLQLETQTGSVSIRIATVLQYDFDMNRCYIVNSVTPPTSDPSGGGYLYVEAGSLKFRGSAGTVTTLGAA